jgi:hypothetical protein
MKVEVPVARAVDMMLPTGQSAATRKALTR